jgi:hypothetical protein
MSVTSGISKVVASVQANPITPTVEALAVGGAVGALAVGAGVAIARKVSRKRKKSKASHSRKRKSRRKLKFGSKAYRRKYLNKRKRYTPHTAGKRRDTSRRRIRYTTKGQPYVIGSHGKAKFISKKSAGIDRKRKGGKY